MEITKFILIHGQRNNDFENLIFWIIDNQLTSVTVDGESDIFLILLKVIDSGAEFTIVGNSDDDDDSPIDGYSDRSQVKVSLKKGRYLVVIGALFDVPERYRLQVEWM